MATVANIPQSFVRKMKGFKGVFESFFDIYEIKKNVKISQVEKIFYDFLSRS